jgi:hypothetical protein
LTLPLVSGAMNHWKHSPIPLGFDDSAHHVIGERDPLYCCFAKLYFPNLITRVRTPRFAFCLKIYFRKQKISSDREMAESILSLGLSPPSLKFGTR